MNWISNFVRPKIDAIFSKKESTENIPNIAVIVVTTGKNIPGNNPCLDL